MDRPSEHPPVPPAPGDPQAAAGEAFDAFTHLPPGPFTPPEQPPPPFSSPCPLETAGLTLQAGTDYAAWLAEVRDEQSWAHFVTWERLRPLFNLCLVALVCLVALPVYGSGMEVVDPLPRLPALVIFANLGYCLVPLATLGLGWLGTPRRLINALASGLALCLSLALTLVCVLVLFRAPPHG